MNLSKMDKKLISLTDRKGFKLAIFLIASMTTISGSVIAPALPSIAQKFHSIPHIDILTPLVMSLPALFVALFAPLAGLLMDKFGRLKLLYVGMLTWSLAGMAGALCENIYILLATRALFGIATAFVMNGANVLVADYFSSGGRREVALSAQNATMAFTGVSMSFAVGYLASFSSEATFFVYGIGIIMLLLSLPYLFEPKRTKENKKSKLDSPHLNKSKASLHNDIWRLGGVMFMGVFVCVIFYVCPTQMPFVLTHTLHISSTLMGVLLAIPAFHYGLVALLYKHINTRLGIIGVFILATLLNTIGFILLGLFHHLLIIVVAFGLIGCGSGLLSINTSAWLFRFAPANVRARYFGLLASAIFLGQFLSPLITQPLVRLIDIHATLVVCAFACFCVGVAWMVIGLQTYMRGR